jgi:methylated-DNA-protein-cysteine methyltransferase related protein
MITELPPDDAPIPPLYERIYAMVRQIPPGQVATYGQIAELVGMMGRARQVGYALFRVAPDADIPWHRVINAQGQVSRSPMREGNDDLQQHLLEAEGIVFDKNQTIDLKKYRWQPHFKALEEQDSACP